VSVEADAASQGLALVRAALDGRDHHIDRHLQLAIIEYLAGLTAELLQQMSRHSGVEPAVLLDRLEVWTMAEAAGEH